MGRIEVVEVAPGQVWESLETKQSVKIALVDLTSKTVWVEERGRVTVKEGLDDFLFWYRRIP